MSSQCLPFNATATDAEMGVSFHTSLCSDIKIHSSYEKYPLHKRNALHVAIVRYEYIKKYLVRNLAPDQKNFIRVYCQEGIV